MTAPTTTTPLTAEERVAAGMAWLDEQYPGWVDRADLDRIDVGSDCDCPLGQELGDFADAPLLLAEAVTLGFYAERDLWVAIPFGRPTHSPAEVDAEYAELTEVWRELILARRAGEPS